MRCVSLSLPLFSLSAVALDVHFIALERLSYSRCYRSRGIARGGVCLRAFSFSFFFFPLLFAREGSCRSKISDIVTFSLSSSRSEIVHIQAGQCGNQIGAKFWEVREGFLSFFSIAVVSCSFFHFRVCVPVGGF